MRNAKIEGVLYHAGMAIGLMLFGISVGQGFLKKVYPEVIVLEGMMASLFWLMSAAVPFYIRRVRSFVQLPNVLNAVAAGATGGALMASVPNAWQTIF